MVIGGIVVDWYGLRLEGRPTTGPLPNWRLWGSREKVPRTGGFLVAYMRCATKDTKRRVEKIPD
jgi:hypothetical protein